MEIPPHIQEATNNAIETYLNTHPGGGPYSAKQRLYIAINDHNLMNLIARHFNKDINDVISTFVRIANEYE